MNRFKLGLLLVVTLIVSMATRAQTATGPSILCIGSPANYFGTPVGGTWSSSTLPIGSINPTTGIATGISAGVCTFTYTLPSSAYATITVTVSIPPTPGTVTGSSTVCLGGSTTFSSTLGGGTWSSSNVAIAAVSSAGVVTGYTLGTTTISHTVSSGGCYGSGTHSITVVPGVTISLPVPDTMCVAFMIGATASVPGGTWTSTDPTRATVSSTGVIITIAPGTTTLVYTLPSGCTAYHPITVVAAPPAIAGPTSVCAGSFITLTDAAPGGTWSSSAPSYAAVDPITGVVVGVAPGTATIWYTTATGCSASTVVAVLPPASISGGGSSVCIGGTTTFTGSPSGGIWSYTGGSISLSGGVVTGVSTGTGVITYTVPSGCMITAVVTVMPAPSGITGTTTLCAGTTTTLMCATSGGTWSSGATAVATVSSATGVVTGVAAGTCVITYSLATGCYSTTTVAVTPPAAISGTGSAVCIGSSMTLTGTPPGGTWATASSGISLSGGVVTGISSGLAAITYSSGGCSTVAVVTVGPSPAAIVGSPVVCAGSTLTLTCATPGGTWSSSAPSVGSVAASTGVVTGISGGTATISYAIPTGCSATIILTVNALPSVSASATAASCGNNYTLTASGAATYVWSPATGLSCVSCSSPVASPSASVAYTVVGTSGTCSSAATTTVSVNRVCGHITFSSAAPSAPTLKVWLVKYNPADSSITGIDSTTTCNDAGTEYYQFDGKPSGSYLVKAKLLSSVAGTSGYIPTYGSSTAYWYSAASIAHTTGGVDMQDINMLYGTVPFGTGFISGYVYSGAGKGTAGDIPVAGMLIYLKSSTGLVLAYTYTNSSGTFTFSGLGFGSYVIYPEEESYYTTSSSVITIDASTPGFAGANFRQYLTSGVIKPAVTTNTFYVANALTENGIYPNPAKDFVYISADQAAAGMATVYLTDMTGRSVSTRVVEIGGNDKARFDLTGIAAGIYIMKISSEHMNYTTKLQIQE